MAVKVKILKQVGQLGLRLPGTVILMNERMAENYEKSGWLTIIRPEKPKVEKPKQEPKHEPKQSYKPKSISNENKR